MPRTILILLTVLTAIGVQAEWLSLAGHVPPHMVQYEPADNESTPKINLTFGNDSTSLTFDLRIPFAEITSDTLFPGTFFWNIPGFYPSDIAGTPSLPVRTAMFVLPKNAENISLTENHTDWISINGYLPTPARPAKYDYDVYSISNVPSITRFDNKDAARISKIEHTNSQTIVHVTLSPVYYSGITDVVEACRELNYTLSFSYGNSAQASMRSNHMAPKSVKVEYACEVHMKPSSYVIITTPPYESSIKSYANWKRRFGHEVYILSKDSWTPKEIKDSVSAVYHRTESLDYAIFAGPYKDIPAMISPTYYYKPDESSPNGEMRTDFYYACVNGDNDKTPSIHTGRFIADNVEEMENIIRKEMLYYNTGANTPGFYNNAAHVSRFEVSSYNGSDKTVTTSPFIKTSEALRNHVIANNIHVSRIYDADDGAKPKYWIKNGVKELMPQELQYGNFPWTANTNDVVEAFNDGNFYIMYMAHGALSGWGQPSFGYQDFSRLNNQDALPIVFSMTCNTGNFVSEDGFARHILANDNGGARTVIASERPSFMNYNDAIAIGMFNTLWQTPKIDSDIVNIDKLVIIPIDPSILKSGINYIEQKTIGNILSTGKIWMNHMSSPGQGMIQEHCEMYHIFGDPGMLMNTKPPTAYTDVEYSVDKTSKGPDKWAITLKTEHDAIIGFFNETTGKVERFYTNSVTRNVSPYDNYHLTVHSHNKIPFTIDVIDGRTSFSGPVILKNMQPFTPAIAKAVQSDENVINVDIENYDPEITLGTYSVELRDLNNNLLDQVNITEKTEQVSLHPGRIMGKIYVVTLCNDGNPVDYKKITLK